MDSSRATTPTGDGTFEATPEAALLDADRPTASHETTTARATSPGAHADSVDDAGTAEPIAAATSAGHGFAERLKPVADAAEDVAAKALDVSAKGLAKVAEFLRERKAGRDVDPSPRDME